jgi:hypothetical protein
MTLARDVLPSRVEPSTRPALRLLLQLALVAGAGLVLGAATSLAQTVLSDALRPFANSASGWTLLTAVSVAACRAGWKPSALYGAAGLVALVLGYQVMSTLRGFPTDETLFLLIGVVVGPFVGVAASWLARDGLRASIGCGLLAGIALGEGAYGLLVISATTGWFYWTAIGVAGAALLITTLVRRATTARARLLTIGLTALVAIVFFLAYNGIGQIML